MVQARGSCVLVLLTTQHVGFHDQEDCYSRLCNTHHKFNLLVFERFVIEIQILSSVWVWLQAGHNQGCAKKVS